MCLFYLLYSICKETPRPSKTRTQRGPVPLFSKQHKAWPGIVVLTLHGHACCQTHSQVLPLTHIHHPTTLCHTLAGARQVTCWLRVADQGVHKAEMEQPHRTPAPEGPTREATAVQDHCLPRSATKKDESGDVANPIESSLLTQHQSYRRCCWELWASLSHRSVAQFGPLSFPLSATVPPIQNVEDWFVLRHPCWPLNQFIWPTWHPSQVKVSLIF